MNSTQQTESVFRLDLKDLALFAALMWGGSIGISLSATLLGLLLNSFGVPTVAMVVVLLFATLPQMGAWIVLKWAEFDDKSDIDLRRLASVMLKSTAITLGTSFFSLPLLITVRLFRETPSIKRVLWTWRQYKTQFPHILPR